MIAEAGGPVQQTMQQTHLHLDWCEQTIWHEGLCFMNKWISIEILVISVLIGLLFIFKRKIKPILKSLGEFLKTD